MSDRYVRIRWAASPFRANVTDGVRIRIDVIEAGGMPSKIFAYQSLPMRPSTNQRTHAFDHVCSPPDLADYPEDSPLPNSRPDWLRTDFVDLLLRSDHEAQRFLTQVISDIQALKATLDITDSLQPGGDMFIGNPPNSGASSSMGSL